MHDDAMTFLKNISLVKSLNSEMKWNLKKKIPCGEM